MRALALLLIVANVLYFVWARWIDTPPAIPPTTDVDTNIPTLVLASERPATAIDNVATPKPVAATPSVPSEQVATVAATGGNSCISVGPFQDLPSAVQAAATLNTAGFDSHQRLAQGEMWVGYWLSLQNLRSRDEADRAIATLKKHGITDAYVIPGSEPPNVVSLGVFKEQDRAHRLLAEVKKLGLPVQMADRMRAGSVYWLDVTLSKPDQQIDVAQLGSEPGKILRLELRACPQSARDNG